MTSNKLGIQVVHWPDPPGCSVLELRPKPVSDNVDLRKREKLAHIEIDGIFHFHMGMAQLCKFLEIQVPLPLTGLKLEDEPCRFLWSHPSVLGDPLAFTPPPSCMRGTPWFLALVLGKWRNSFPQTSDLFVRIFSWSQFGRKEKGGKLMDDLSQCSPSRIFPTSISGKLPTCDKSFFNWPWILFWHHQFVHHLLYLLDSLKATCWKTSLSCFGNSNTRNQELQQFFFHQGETGTAVHFCLHRCVRRNVSVSCLVSVRIFEWCTSAAVLSE